MQKQFFPSVIIGMALGFLVSGYMVYAFMSPDQPPPAGNVEPSLNTSDAPQLKGGPLIVNANNSKLTGLQVFGYTQLGTRTGTPPSADCNELAELGRMIVASNQNKRVYICVRQGGSASWEQVKF